MAAKQTKYDKRWLEHFADLAVYQANHGHSNVPRKAGQLGQWCHHQRVAFRKGQLLENRKSLLDEIDFPWDPQQQDHAEQQLATTAKKRKRSATEQPTTKAMETPIIRQTERSVKNPATTKVETPIKRTKRTAIRQTKTTVVETPINISNKFDEKWLEWYEELKVYKEVHGDCRVVRSHGPLGCWVHKQRVKFKEGRLLEERKELLDEVGFIWHPLDDREQFQASKKRKNSL